MIGLLGLSSGRIVVIALLLILLVVVFAYAFRHRTGRHSVLVPYFAPTSRNELKSVIVAAFFIGLLVAAARASGITWFSGWNADQAAHVAAAVAGFAASMCFYKGKAKLPSLVVMLISALVMLFVMSRIPSPVEVMMR